VVIQMVLYVIQINFVMIIHAMIIMSALKILLIQAHKIAIVVVKFIVMLINIVIQINVKINALMENMLLQHVIVEWILKNLIVQN